MTSRRQARTQRVERRWKWAGSCLSQLDRATARLRCDLHAIEHPPGGGAVALWPAAISLSGWLVSLHPPTRPASGTRVGGPQRHAKTAVGFRRFANYHRPV
jgi:hypothetical protein